MPEAVKEVVTEVPQAALKKENTPDKIACKEVKPAEASSGTLPVVDEPSKDEGEGAVAPDLGQGEAPEQGKSETTVNVPMESENDGSEKETKDADNSNLKEEGNSDKVNSTDSADKDGKPENSNTKEDNESESNKSEEPKETVSDESQDSKLPSPEEGKIEESKQSSPEQSKTGDSMETGSSDLSESKPPEKTIPEDNKNEKKKDESIDNSKEEITTSQKNGTEGDDKMDTVEKDKVSVTTDNQMGSDNSTEKAEKTDSKGSSDKGKQEDNTVSSIEASGEVKEENNTVSVGEKVQKEAENEKTDVSKPEGMNEAMETADVANSEQVQTGNTNAVEDSKEKHTEKSQDEKNEPESKTAESKTDSLVENSSEEVSSKQEKSISESKQTDKEISELETNKKGIEEANVDTPQEKGSSEAPGGSKEVDANAAEEVKCQVREGKGLLVVGDYFGAADILGKACETAGKLYGELANENAELYYLYGWAMLECAKKESNVLGEGVKEKDEEEDGEEAVNGDDQMETEENGEVEVEAMAVDEDKSEKDKDTDEVVEKSESQQQSPENQEEAKENGISKESDEEEEDTSLKVAWEMLELAKVTFARLENNERLADTYIKLGEVGIESGHPTALEDMKSALELRKKYFADNHRLISETHFNLGLGLATFELFDEAIEQFKLSKSLLEDKINLLSKSEDQKAQEEIKEIEILLPELDEKMQDMEDSKAAKAKAQALNGEDKPAVDGGESSKPKPISNISHLVKRKRKLEDVANDLLPNTKQPCTEKTDSEKTA